jgi:N-acyl homoserine lactone hydrolase
LGVEVDTVFLTHVHVDHVGWNHIFQGARFVTHRESVALAVERGRPLPEGTEAVAGETELAPGVVAFETPGHLAGHMSVRVGDSLIVLGDPALCAETREHVLAAYGDLTLACGHYPAAGFGRVENGVWSPVG